MRQVRFFDRAHNSCPTAEGTQSRITELTLDSFDSTSDELLIERIAVIGLSRDARARGVRRKEETVEAATMKNATCENFISLSVSVRAPRFNESINLDINKSR